MAVGDTVAHRRVSADRSNVKALHRELGRLGRALLPDDEDSEASAPAEAVAAVSSDIAAGAPSPDARRRRGVGVSEEG